MSFDHKAFDFDWNNFSLELAPVLASVLVSGNPTPLENFIGTNLACCSSPYDGTPLTVSWKDDLEFGGLQELADFALTKYYCPNENFGLGDVWSDLQSALAPAESAALLGQPFGPPERLFDPGYQGSYFQSPSAAQLSAQMLMPCANASIKAFAQRLESISNHGKGLYVTF